jgi:pimeloyl-ACP methyl ester carboxylesterase
VVRRIAEETGEGARETTMNEKTTTSEYLLLFRNTGWHADLSAEEIQQNMARFTEWFERVNQAGQFKGGGPLGHYGKILAGKHAATDGPFVESKEAIAGFFLVRAENLEQAVEIGKGCPGLGFGQTVEVRAMVTEPHELQVAREKKSGLQQTERHNRKGRSATVNGLKMYYEIHGNGRPLVLLHGGGSTICSTFGRILPELAKTHQVIALELQAHGHTPDMDRPLSFEQDADDVAALLEQLQVAKSDVMGFSNGGTTSLQIAIRHPELVNKLVLASTIYKRDGMQSGFWDGMPQASLQDMPKPLQDAYLEANPDPEGLQAMFDRDVARMLAFQDISDANIRRIQAPALVLNGAAEVVRAEHALALSRALRHAQLAILPGGHGDYIGEICAADIHSPIPTLVTAMIEAFLKA